MKLKSEVIGGVVTGLYLLLIVALVYWKWDTVPKLELNEFGDFLAGVFGPVAFLWLILGYIQQGRELKQSSKALQLQASELKNSVEQQAQLVAVGREQIEVHAGALSQERQRYERGMNAYIIFSPIKSSISDTCVTQLFEVHNAGADVFDVQFMCKLPGHNLHGKLGVLKRDQKTSLQLNFELVDENYFEILHCFYKTHDERRIGFTMDIEISAESQRASITARIKLADL